ncbi:MULTISPECIES: hypothetical protein [unclassified Sphingobium]|nr:MULTISPECIES: hypothetical protein [unclassified Sphingobium]MCW2412671.1 hypothetical protein [Sphingobium sp. B8D3D]MCW2415031.1 hypothetical protein [Sphingobium sp. B8D3A]
MTVQTPSPREARSRSRRWLRIAFYAFGWFAIALQAYNFYLFVGLIGK